VKFAAAAAEQLKKKRAEEEFSRALSRSGSILGEVEGQHFAV
jgi:hypothetical protein